MNSKQVSQSNSANMVQCPLHCFGCTQLFQQNQSSQHLVTSKHVKTLMSFIQLEGIKYDETLDELAINPSGTDENSNKAASVINKYEQFMGNLTDIIVETYHGTLLTTAAASGSSNFDQIYRESGSPSRTRLEQLDRDSNDVHDVKSHQTAAQINEPMFDNILNLITLLSTDSSKNHNEGQNSDPLTTNAQQNISQFHQYSNAILQTELESKPVSTDGCLIWRIKNIFEMIDNAISRKEEYVNSPMFQVAINGHQFWVRLFLNGSTDPKFISIHVQLDFRVTQCFRGTVKVALVDLSSHKPLVHHIKESSGEITDDNRYIHFNEFLDKNLLHQDESRYIGEDSICLIVYIPQTLKQKFANLSENVRDALMELMQPS